MKCEQAREILSVTTPATRTRWTASRLHRHLRRCPTCGAMATWTASLDEQLRDWRADAPPPRLAVRIEEALQCTLVPPMPARRPFASRRLPLGVMALVAAVLIPFLALRGERAGAAMQRIEDAVSQVRCAHITMWTVATAPSGGTTGANAPLEKVEEEWYQGSRWRKEGKWGSRLIVALPAAAGGVESSQSKALGTYYRYDARARRVISMTETAQQQTQFTLAAITGMDTHPGAYQLENLGAEQDHGRTIRDIVVTQPEWGRSSRYLCKIDSATSLPVRIDSQQQSDGQWRTMTRFDFEFNQTLPPSLFDPQNLKHERWTPTNR